MSGESAEGGRGPRSSSEVSLGVMARCCWFTNTRWVGTARTSGSFPVAG